jgi:hypothetical protein
MESKVGVVKRDRLSIKREFQHDEDLKEMGGIDKDKGRSRNPIFERCLLWRNVCCGGQKVMNPM